MKDWLFLLACVSPLLSLGFLAMAMVTSWHYVLIAALTGYTVSGFLSPSYYRGIRDIRAHGVHNDR